MSRKGATAAANGDSDAGLLAAGTSILPSKAEDRIYVDNSNVSELKTTCDEAVERVSFGSSVVFRELSLD